MKKLLHDLVRILSAQFIVMVVLVGLVILGYSCRKSLFIAYHRLGQKSALKAMRRAATPQLQRDRHDKHVARLQHHQKALIRLGYLEERGFQPKFLTSTSPQREAMLEEFRRRHPGASYSHGWSKSLTIIDRPERMPTWESLIREYDVPPTDPNQPSGPGHAPKAEVP